MNRAIKALTNPRWAIRRLWERTKDLGRVLTQDLCEEANSYWGESEDDPTVRDMSHWRGAGRWVSDEAWLGIGEANYQKFRVLRQLAAWDRPIGRMVEWGPGGGANAVRFAREVKEIYGVDISAPNLAECARQLKSANFDGFSPCLIDPEKPEQCLERIATPVDFFLSTAVYQHFPSKAYGRRVTRVACQLLADGGIALIQTRYDDGSERNRSKKRDYRENVVRFTSYGIDEFWKIAVDSGFHPLCVDLSCSFQYAYYYLRKPRTGSE